MREKELLHHPTQSFDIHLLRWEDLPDFGIYSDQVLTIIESQLSFLDHSETERIITPAMVNNYVKHGLIERPIKKKYYKLHIAKLMVITLLKQVLPLTDVQKGIDLQVKRMGVEEAYNTFCDELEEAAELVRECLKKKEEFSFTLSNINHDNMALKMVTLSLVTKIMTQKIILTQGAQNLNHSAAQVDSAANKGESSFEK